MEWHKKADLAVLDPLPDAIACAALHARNKRSVVDDAVKDLPHRAGGSGSTSLRSAMLGTRARATRFRGAHTLWNIM